MASPMEVFKNMKLKKEAAKEGEAVPFEKKEKAKGDKDDSPIHIKPSHKGRFTAKANKAGESVQAFAQKVKNDPNADPTTKKQAVFAANAKKFKH